MRILHVIDTLGTGGAERLLVTMLPELQRQGVECSVAVLRGPLDLKSALEEAGIAVSVLPSHHKANLIAGARNVHAAGRRVRADIIHTHLFFPSIYAAIGRTFRFSRARTAVTFHNLAFAPGANKRGPGMLLRKWLARIFYKTGMDCRFAVSQAAANLYAETLRPGSITVLYNPVDLNAIDLAANEIANNNDDSAAVLLLPGRLVHEKGHRIFLEALKRLADRDIAFSAVLAGDGPLRLSIETTIKEFGLSDRVTVSGLLAHEEMMRVMAQATVVVVPSMFEGFGLTAVEAMGLGRPVVVSNAGGLPEVVGDDGGMIVPAGNAAALAEALEELLGDPTLRQSLGAAGKARARAEFSLPRIATLLVDHYRTLCPTSPRTGR